MSPTAPDAAPDAVAAPAAPASACALPLLEGAASRRVLWAAAGLLVLHVVLAWILRQPAVATGNDDALYLLLGRALRAGSYRDLHVLGQPWHSQYPPGYPLLLALFGGTLGPAIEGPRLLGITLSGIALLALFDLARRLVPPAFALALLAMLAVNPFLLTFAGAVRSEMPYITLSCVALWLLVVWPERRAAVVGGTVAVLLGGLTRSVGLALAAAAGAAMLLERRWRRLGGFTLVMAATVGLWLLWMFRAPEQFEARSYSVMLTMGAPAERSPLGLVLGRVERSFSSYLLNGGLGSALGVPRLEGTTLDNIVGMGLTLALAAAGMLATWRRASLLSLYLAAYGALLLGWTYKLTRFLIPIVPLLLLLAVVGAEAISRRWRPAPRGALLGGLLLFYLAGGVQGFRRNYSTVGGCPRDDVTSPAACLTPVQRGFFEALPFLRDSLPAGTVLVSTKEAVLGLYTGRPQLHGQALHVRYGKPFFDGLRRQGEAVIVLSRLHLWHVPEEMVERCEEFELVRSYQHHTDLIRLRPPGGASAGREACAAIRYHAGLFTPPL